MPSLSLAVDYTGLDLLQQGFPNVISYPDHRTPKPSLPTSSSAGKDWYGGLGPWSYSDFFNRVRRRQVLVRNWNSLVSVKHPSADLHSLHNIMRTSGLGGTLAQALIPRSMPPLTNSIHGEHFVCGEEKGTEARFGQHALNVMNAIAEDSGCPIRFANFKVASNGGTEMASSGDIATGRGFDGSLQPDIVAIERGNFNMRLCGEVKACWDDSLVGLFTHMTGLDSTRRRWLGQIGRYMAKFCIKFAFLTIHTFTVFLRMTVDTRGVAHLEFSRAIHCQTSSTADTLSVRECLWYMMVEASEGGWKNPPANEKATRVHFATARPPAERSSPRLPMWEDSKDRSKGPAPTQSGTKGKSSRDATTTYSIAHIDRAMESLQLSARDEAMRRWEKLPSVEVVPADDYRIGFGYRLIVKGVSRGPLKEVKLHNVGYKPEVDKFTYTSKKQTFAVRCDGSNVVSAWRAAMASSSSGS